MFLDLLVLFGIAIGSVSAMSGSIAQLKYYSENGANWGR
jgi:hypothetical protein